MIITVKERRICEDDGRMETEVVYLHFLNRELYRESKLNLYNLDLLLCNALKIAYLFNYEPLDASIAFIWELYYDFPQTRNMLLKLLQTHLLHPVSSFYTVDELIAFNQCIYREETNRYNMYFDKIPHQLEKYNPEIIKTESTTIKLETDLNSWINTGMSELFVQEQDRILLHQSGKKIKKTLEQRDNKAITLSLFDGINLSVYNRKQLARNLSLVHIYTYMQHVNGDIITGINGSQFFDRLSKGFPLYDFGVNCCIIEICDRRALNLNSISLLIEEERKSKSVKIVFIEEVRKIIRALYKCISDDMKYQSNIRNAICNRIKRAAIKMPERQGNMSWQHLLSRIIMLDNCLRKNDSEYLENRMEEDKMIKTVLICTATDKETDVVLAKAKEYSLSIDVDKLEETYLYHLGIMGSLDLFLAQTEMGTERMGSARDKIRDIARLLKPHYIMSTGICYGLKPKSVETRDGNKIGDIIVANQLQMYETAKVRDVGNKVQYIPRGDKAAVSTELLDAFRIASHLYDKKINISFGLLLTGNLLVNSRYIVSELKKNFPEAINGDMEAGGIYSACHDKGIKWIAIKSISDWGYDKTDEHQSIARKNLYDFLFYVFEKGIIN